MLRVRCGDLAEVDQNSVFYSYPNFFRAFFTNDLYNTPFFKLLILAVDNSDISPQGVVVNREINLPVSVQELSSGVKQLITMVIMANNSDYPELPDYIGSRIGDNCWDWMFLISHLDYFREKPLKLIMNYIPPVHDKTVYSNCFSQEGDVIRNQEELYLYVFRELKGISLEPCMVKDNPRNPPYFDAFRHLCQSPEQICSLEQLNHIAQQVLDSSDSRTSLFSQ